MELSWESKQPKVLNKFSFLLPGIHVLCCSICLQNFVGYSPEYSPSACLHLLLEEFISGSTLYYSTTASALDTFLNHARQLRNSAVKLSPSTIVKKILVLAKGPGFKYDPSEVMLLLEVISVCVLCVS